MSFLLAEILILLALAALLGAALASWWIRRRYQDVTVEFSSMEELRRDLAAAREGKGAAEASLARLGGEQEALKRQAEEQAAWRRALDGKLADLGRVDLAPVTERLAALERKEPKAVDLSPVERQVQAVGAAVGAFRVPATDLGPVVQRLAALEQRIQPVDLKPVLDRLAALEHKEPKAVDLAPVERQVQAVGAAVAAWKAPAPADLGPVVQRLAALEQRIQPVDLKPVLDRLAALEHKEPKAVDLGPVERQVQAVGAAMAAFRVPATDLGPVVQRLAALEQRIQPVDLGPVQERLAGVERRLQPVDLQPVLDRLSALEHKEPKAVDLSPVERQVQAVGAAVAAWKAPAPADLGPVVQRLSALEQRIQPVDWKPIVDRLSALEHKEPRPVDLSPVERQVQAVGAAVAAWRPADLGPLQQRLTALEARIQPTDLRPVLERLAALERKEHPATDLGPVLARFGAVEAGLAGWKPTDLSDVTARLARLEALLQRPVPAPAPAPRQPGANLLASPVHGKPDDLKVIKGIAEKLERLLHRLGVYYFWQMAEWDRRDVDHVNGRLEAFKGRIDRDRWVAQARDLARLPDSAKPPA